MSWLQVDWSAERPSHAEIRASRQALTYRPLPVDGEHTLGLLEQLRAVHSNGGALLAAFQVEGDDPTAAWFFSRNRFDEYGLFEHLLTSDALRAALPALVAGRDVRQDEPPFRESFAGAYVLDGWLARVLKAGGAYKSFGGTATEAKELAARATEEIVGGRYDEFHVYSTYEPWSHWFGSVAWDSTHVLVDDRHRRFYLLALTDTD